MGLDYSYQMVVRRGARHIHCGGVPMAIGVQTDMATPALARFGCDELCKEFLAPAIAGDDVACLGVSEAGAGSDVAAIKTTARKDGGDYVINGAQDVDHERHRRPTGCACSPTPATARRTRTRSLIFCR